MHAEHRKYRMEAELRAFRMILDVWFPDLPALNCTLLASFRRLLRSSHASAACWYLVSKNTVISFLISKEWSNYGHCHFRILNGWIMLSCRKNQSSRLPCSALDFLQSKQLPRESSPQVGQLVSYCMTAFAKIKALVSQFKHLLQSTVGLIFLVL